MRQDGHVALALDPAPLTLQVAPQFFVVEDLSVADAHHCFVFVPHRLMTAFAIYNGQSLEPEPDVVINDMGALIRSAVRDRGRHPFDRLPVRPASACKIKNAYDSAHL